MIAQISPLREMGTRTGTFFMFVSLGGLTGNPIGGALIGSAHGGFGHLQIFCGVTMAAGAAVYFVARYVQVGFKPTIV